jgi:putative ABC transport system ATP-binding protein
MAYAGQELHNPLTHECDTVTRTTQDADGNMNTLIDLINVRKIYDSSSRPALDGVSLRIAAGEVTAIMGPSGSGKSTLLNLMAGLDHATSGSIVVGGQEITGLNEGALARYRRGKIGLVFQFFNLLNNLTAMQNVLIPAQLGGTGSREAMERAHQLLDQLGIAEVANSFPGRLSGGQRQRVAIARALINRPSLLLADEPTGALDTRTGEGVLDLFRNLSDAGQTIVLITHDSRLAERCAHRTVRLVDGAIISNTVAMEAVR